MADNTNPNLKWPPKLESDDNYESWKKDIEVWRLLTDVKPAKQALAIHLTLTGKARMATSELKVEELNSDDGVKNVIKKLDELFLKDKSRRQFMAFKRMYGMRRETNVSISNFIPSFEHVYYTFKQEDMTLPDPVVAFMLLAACNMSDNELQLVMSAVTEVTYDNMKLTLKRVSDIGLSAQSADAPAKFDEVELKQETFYSRGRPGTRGHFRGGRRINPRSRGVAPRAQRIETPSNRRRLNPIGSDGEVSKCRICDSKFHWARSCPDAYDGLENQEVSDTVCVAEGELKDVDSLSMFVAYANGNDRDREITHTLLQESFGSAVIDTGCLRTCAGIKWVENYVKNLTDFQKSSITEVTSNASFTFGDGKTYLSQKCLTLPCFMGTFSVKITTEVVTADIPLLLGKNAMKKVGMSIDLEKDLVRIRDRTIKLDTSSTGHYMVRLNRSVEEKIFLNLSVDTEGKARLLKLHRQFSHPSAGKLIDLLRSAKASNRWIESEVHAITKECEICLKLKKTPPKPVVCLPMASRFNETIAMDLKFYDDVYFLVIVDLATRYCTASVIRDKKSSTIVKNVMISWISRFGPSLKILTDNGKEFQNEEFRSMGEMFNITILTTAAESPFSNGCCERMNAVIGRNVKKIMLDSKCSIDEALAWSVSARNSLSNSSGFSPNQLVFGFNPCLPNVAGDKLPALEQSTFEMVRRNLNAMHSARQSAIQAESSERIKRALKHNVRPTETSQIEIGHKVYYKRNGDDHWHGPGTVIGKDGKQIFVRHGGSYVRVHSTRLQREPVNIASAKANHTVTRRDQATRICDTILDEDTIENEDENEQTAEVVNDSVPEEHNDELRPAPPSPEPPQQQLKLKIGDRFEGTDTASGEVYSGKIISRGGKATGKYKNSFNVQKDKDKSIMWVDFDKDIHGVKTIEDSEEVLISYNSDEVMMAKTHEIDNWKRNHVYEEVKPGNNMKPISVRWVITEKLKNGKPTVKARLVARGFEEDTSRLKKDSPTCSKEAVRITVSIANAMKWKINSMDVKSAYLQSNRIDRDIYLDPPPEFHSGKLWKLNKPVYGLNDAGRAWYLKVKDVLLKLGGRISPLEPALFSWKDGDFYGLVCVYVDDFMWAGTQKFMKVINEIQKTFNIGANEESNFKYIGLNLQTCAQGVTLDQIKYIESIKPLSLSGERKKQKGSQLVDEEVRSYRKAIGQLNWVATHSRPDISFDVCDLSVNLKTATVQNIVQMNKLIERIKTDALKLSFPKLESIENCSLECYSDAAYANLPDEGSQGGFIIFLKGKNRSPIAWQSRKIKRVVKSTLAAEALALLDCAETALYIAEIISGMTGSRRMKIDCFVDNKSLVDNLETYHNVEDKRLRIDMAILREMIDRKEIETVNWIDSESQLADCLTKKGASTETLIKSVK